MARGEHGVMRIEVVYSPSARIVDTVELRLEEGSTVAQALRASGLEQRHPNIDLVTSPVGVWGRLCAGSEPLRDGDRVELYRPLQVDPKEARRLRFRSQASRGIKTAR